MSSQFREVDGVAWCVEHEGILDEWADHLDDEGEPCCDMARDLANKCRIVPLWVENYPEAEQAAQDWKAEALRLRGVLGKWGIVDDGRAVEAPQAQGVAE